MRVCVFSFLAMSSLSVAFVVSPRYCCSSYLTLFLLSFLIPLWKYELLISFFSLYYYWIATWLCSSSYLHTTFIVYTPMSFPLKSLTQYQKETTTCHFYATVYWLLLDYFLITWLQCKLTLWVRSVIMYSNLHLYWHVHLYLWTCKGLDKKALRLCKSLFDPTPPLQKHLTVSKLVIIIIINNTDSIRKVQICLHNRQSLKQNRYVTIYMLLFTPVRMTVYY